MHIMDRSLRTPDNQCGSTCPRATGGHSQGWNIALYQLSRPQSCARDPRALLITITSDTYTSVYPAVATAAADAAAALVPRAVGTDVVTLLSNQGSDVRLGTNSRSSESAPEIRTPSLLSAHSRREPGWRLASPPRFSPISPFSLCSWPGSDHGHRHGGNVGAGGYLGCMASPAAADLPASDTAALKADPVAIRACLSPRLVTEFDAEWESVLEQAKASKDLAGVHKLLQKWRHLAYAELRDPGSYFRLLAKAEQIMRTGENPTAGSFEDMQTLIRERLGQ
jgi:hypothetical protein